MSKEEVLQNLGTIAKSGSLEFLQKAGNEANKDIIGQVCSYVQLSRLISMKPQGAAECL